MNTKPRADRDLRALWFGDEVALLGHLHVPRSKAVDLAVVVCAPPFGYENIGAYRALRVLADRFASRGMATLRFDFPGTGDSSGVQSVAAWKSAVAQAVTIARRETGCTRIALVGVGLAGTIATAALDDGLDIDKLVVWGAPVRGKLWLRQQRAYARVTALPIDPRTPPPALPEGIEDLSGFPLTAALADQLSALDVSKASWDGDRTRPLALVLSRNPKEPDAAFGETLRTRGFDVVAEGHEGFDQIHDEPHLATAPEPIFARMADWLAAGESSRAAYAASDEGHEAIVRIGDLEEVARYTPGDDGLLFSIETRPVSREADPTWLVFLAGGAVRHVGPNRMWVRFARELAAQGYSSLRLDCRSIGDSEGSDNSPVDDEPNYREYVYDDVERILSLGKQRGATQFLLAGICSGATASYWVATRRRDVRAVLLLNPLQLKHDTEDHERAKVQEAKKFALRKELWLNPRSYLRLLRGELPTKRVLDAVLSLSTLRSVLGLGSKAPEESYVAAGFRSLAERPVEIDIFISEGDRSVTFLERHFGAGLANLARPHLRAHRVANTDHTIRALFAQDRFFDILRAALHRVAPAKVARSARAS